MDKKLSISRSDGKTLPNSDQPAVEGSVTIWLQALKEGDSEEALSRLWERYHGKLLKLARQNLRGLDSRAVDEEDVALSAFNRFYEAAEAGRLSKLTNRGDLWKLLLKITLDKAIDTRRRETAGIRGGGQVYSLEQKDSPGFAADAIDDDIDPELATILADEYTRLMSMLGSRDLELVALYRLNGYTNKEIAQSLGLVERTIERRLNLIRKIWLGRRRNDG